MSHNVNTLCQQSFSKVIHDICISTRHQLRLGGGQQKTNKQTKKGHLIGILVSRFDPGEVVTALLHSHLREVKTALQPHRT